MIRHDPFHGFVIEDHPPVERRGDMQNWRLRAELIVDRPRIPPDFRREKIDHDRWSVGRGIRTRMTVNFISKPTDSGRFFVSR